MTGKRFSELSKEWEEYHEQESKIGVELTAIEMLGKISENGEPGYFDPENETKMTARVAGQIIQDIDHEELDKVDCNYQVVYDDLNNRYSEILKGMNKVGSQVQRQGNVIRLRAIEFINESIEDLTASGTGEDDVGTMFLVDHLEALADFLRTGETN